MGQIPHLLTLLRLLLAPVLAWLIVSFRYHEALLMVLFAALTDWLDGYTARQFGTSGKVGVILDPMADKVMLVTLFFALTYVNLIPLWVLILVVGRDLVIVTGASLLRFLRGMRKFAPSTIGKVSTFFQIVLVLLVLFYAAFPFTFLLWLKTLALILAILFTAWSGFGYVRLGIRLEKSSRGMR